VIKLKPHCKQVKLLGSGMAIVSMLHGYSRQCSIGLERYWYWVIWYWAIFTDVG